MQNYAKLTDKELADLLFEKVSMYYDIKAQGKSHTGRNLTTLRRDIRDLQHEILERKIAKK